MTTLAACANLALPARSDTPAHMTGIWTIKLPLLPMTVQRTPRAVSMLDREGPLSPRIALAASPVDHAAYLSGLEKT
jgi:hypothetical protein